jgi:hypothetical protein
VSESGGTVFALNRILVPTNLGEPSQTAIQYGVAFARQFGAKLFLLQLVIFSFISVCRSNKDDSA